MDYINRYIEPAILDALKPGKAIVLLGARRVGKTELLKFLRRNLSSDHLFLNGDDLDTNDILSRKTVQNYRGLIGDHDLLIIDEAQEIDNIGSKIKLMLDSFDGLRIIATGSSAFDLKNQTGEPLVGRKTSFHLFPFAQMELSPFETNVHTKVKLPDRLVFGTYPELDNLTSKVDKIGYLKEILDSYLLKDILTYDGIKNRSVIYELLRKVAYRVGTELSIEGLGNELGISKNTVDRYLDILSKVFVIHQVSGFSRNLDNEITKKKKWYFYDNGIRNALIANFNDLDLRDDVGALWENYLVAERMKRLSYMQSYAHYYFWRTHRGQEIDWVEEIDGKLYAYEFKWNNRKARVPSAWERAYPDADYTVVNRENYLDFIVARI